jgi:hypothetical protein
MCDKLRLTTSIVLYAFCFELRHCLPAQLASGGAALTQKKFKSLNQSVLTQIGGVLEDKERLLKRTQLKRVPFRVLGSESASSSSSSSSSSAEAAASSAATSTSSADGTLIDEHDAEVFDDHDFYQQLLRDLIASGGDAADAAGSDKALLLRFAWLSVREAVNGLSCPPDQCPPLVPESHYSSLHQKTI